MQTAALFTSTSSSKMILHPARGQRGALQGRCLDRLPAMMQILPFVQHLPSRSSRERVTGAATTGDWIAPAAAIPRSSLARTGMRRSRLGRDGCIVSRQPIEVATQLTIERTKVKVSLMSGCPGGILVLNEGGIFYPSHLYLHNYAH